MLRPGRLLVKPPPEPVEVSLALDGASREGESEAGSVHGEWARTVGICGLLADGQRSFDALGGTPAHR